MGHDLLEDIFPEDVKTLSDLVLFMGELTEQESTMLEDPSLYAEPTQEELEWLGPDFIDRVTCKVLARLTTSHAVS